MLLCIHTHTHTHTYIYIYYMWVYVCVYIYIYMYVCVCVCVCERERERERESESERVDKKTHFLHAAIVSILHYGWPTWTLTKCIKKKLDRNCARMLRSVLNKSWKQKQQLYGPQHPISKTIQIRRTSMQDSAVEVNTSSLVMSPLDRYTWTCKCRSTK